MYHSRRTDFTLSTADDLMDFLAGGSHQVARPAWWCRRRWRTRGRRPM